MDDYKKKHKTNSRKRNFELVLQSNPVLRWFASLCSLLVPKTAPLSQPIKLKTNTNRDLVARVFPRIKQFT